MKNESGFIATSLIYTFFLAFIAILTALLSNYIANKTILDRYNSDTQSKLNGGIGKISLYVSYASVDGGKTITNLVRNGNFSSVDGSNNLADWSVQGGGNFQAADFGKRCVIKTGSSGNLSQPISVDSTHKYYIRMEYYQPSIGYTSDVFVSNTVSGDVIDRDRIISSSNSSEWVSTSKLVSLSGAETLSYMIVGKQSTYNTNRTYYTNIFLMDVTYAYRDAVSLEWLDKNIDYYLVLWIYFSNFFGIVYFFIFLLLLIISISHLFLLVILYLQVFYINKTFHFHLLVHLFFLLIHLVIFLLIYLTYSYIHPFLLQ